MTIESRISPLRFKCSSCGTTHALLPDVLIPYSPYSLRFKLVVLIACFERDTTIVAACDHFGIAVSTLYAWKARLLEHKELLLGVLASRKESFHAFLGGLLRSDCLSSRLYNFFHRHDFSFLQHQSMTAARSLPP